MTGSGDKEGRQQQVEAVLGFINASLVASIASMILAHQLLQSQAARKPPLWKRVAWLPWKLYYTVVDAVGALREKAVEWLRREVCEKRCDCVCE
jgi:hypothetical protein